MSGIESVSSILWWLPYVSLIFSAACIAVGFGHAYSAFWLWRHRDTPISDPLISKALKGVKPPPYAFYAACWLFAGFVLAVLAMRFDH